MGMRCRPREEQESLLIAADQLPKSPGHAFSTKLNKLLSKARFDPFAEELCKPHYDSTGNGRSSISPGIYFRMLLVGYFEGIGS